MPSSDLITSDKMQGSALAASEAVRGAWTMPVASALATWIMRTRRQVRSIRELTGWQRDAASHFVRPGFLSGYDIRHGTAKSSGIHTYGRLGAMQNFGGTLMEIALDQLPAGLPETGRYVRDEVRRHADTSALLRSIDASGRNAFTRIRHVLQDFLYKFHVGHDQATFHQRRSEKHAILSNGGFVVDPTMRKLLLDHGSSITYILTEDAMIKDPEGGMLHLPADTRLDQVQVEAIAAAGTSMPWAIAEVDGSGRRRGEVLVSPQTYPHAATLYADNTLKVVSHSEHEARRPFVVSGAIWAYRSDGAQHTMAIGGDKAPGSAVGAPLNPLFLDLLLREPENIRAFKGTTGETPRSFVAALEFRFPPDRPAQIPWRDRYAWPIYGHPAQDDAFLGVHDLRHVESIRVKSVQAL